jgi:uncharacterized Fe-S cluster-containing radical SAM superfamily enzyme
VHPFLLPGCVLSGRISFIRLNPVTVVASVFPPLKRGQLTTLQVNLGYRCNQSCAHCHVNAGPTRTEMMSADLLALIS